MHFGGTLPRSRRRFRRRRRNRGSRRRRRAWTTSRGRRPPDPSVGETLLRALRSSSPRRGTRGSGPNPNRYQNLIPGPSPLARGRRPRRRRDRRHRERARLTSGVWCLGPHPPRWTPRRRRRGWDRPRRGPRPRRCPGDDRRADRSRRSRRDSTTVNRRPRLRPRPRRSPRRGSNRGGRRRRMGSTRRRGGQLGGAGAVLIVEEGPRGDGIDGDDDEVALDGSVLGRETVELDVVRRTPPSGGGD